MCIVADPPTFIPMFKVDDPEHEIFSPVKKWITDGPGKFIIGGTTYKKELSKLSSALRFLTELEKKNKIIRKSDADVDNEEKNVKSIEPAKDFDDPHLVALIRLSGCKVICLRDARAHRFLQKSSLYASAPDRPKLYTAKSHQKLLCKQNIAPCCR